jgi:branched-chain amino acid transport system substrate-binding protein
MALRLRSLFVVISLLATMGCAPPEPVRIGFVGSLSGRAADLSIGGRNGALLAVEQKNKTGGINGRQIEMAVEDNQMDPSSTGAFDRLRERNVVGIIGPMTSTMALAMVPLANTAKLPVISPTVTTNQLTGIDDYFFRVIGPTRSYAQNLATHHRNVAKLRRVAVAIDEGNLAYTESWLGDYREAMTAAGGEIVSVSRFKSSERTLFTEIASEMLSKTPDGVLILGNSVDTANIAQQIRKLDPVIVISSSEWAATERLVELGGQAVDGMTLPQFFDRTSTEPDYIAFRQAFVTRFSQEPGFAGVTGFDAANVLIDALERQEKGQELKQAILAKRQYQGVQGPIPMDAFGDSARQTFVTVIRNGKFEVVK